jgi:mono/diheme cytochrome c family protein
MGGLGASRWMVAAAALAAALAVAPPLVAQEEHPGRSVYEKWCAGCHGVEGDGNGPAAAWMLPRPRDFTEALYQVRTTPSGALPTDADIRRVIDEGMPGTTMPGWEGHLSRAERDDLVGYLKSFSRFFEMEDAPPPIEIGTGPGMTAETIEDGRRLYRELECWKCHGDAGRGDGASAPTQTDDAGFPIRPADLSENWMFNGGGSVEAIYTRLRTGLDGTPMPSFADLVDADVITDDELWHVAHYVRSLSPESEPEIGDVVRATRVEGVLPSSPADSAWAGIDRFYVPLVGQIIQEPRWFAPAVDGVWVQAAHDGETLAMRLVWHDPSRSPDPAWDDWRALLAQHLEPLAGGAPPPDVADVLTIQFPSAMPEGRELPYFLGGDAGEPVYRWRWTSDGGLEEQLARGLEDAEPLPETSATPTAAAEFEAGQWRVVVRRSLGSDDPQRRLAFPTGEAVPVAFFAQDGSSGETASRGSVSSWYYLYLDTPVPATVYTLPITAALITALLGWVVVTRARRTERRAREQEPRTVMEGA